MNNVRSYRRWALIGIRVLLGALFLLSGIGKLINSSDARYLVELMATRFYWLIEYSSPIVLGLSVLELLLGLLLLLNRYLKITLWASAGLFLFFIGVLGYFYLQGMSVGSCGCFGAFGFGSGIAFTLIRNAVLLVLAGAALYLNARLPGRGHPADRSGM